MAEINVGRIRPVYAGAHDSSTAYEFLDWVTGNGGSYICINKSGAAAGTALTNETYWAMCTEKGERGEAAGFGTPTATASTLEAGSNASVAVTASGDDTAKVFTFKFGIPKGDTGAAAGFGTPTASASSLDAEAVPTVEVSATGDDTAKVLAFTFGIPKGEPGANGTTPTFTVGTVTTGEAGTNASVEITGEAPNYVLNFTIPQGASGGEAATPTFTIGTVSTGEAGTSASVEITGTAPDYVLNLTIPQGAKGDAGEGFSIYKTYESISEMEADAENVEEGKFVLIASDVEDEDNAKLYVKGAETFTYLTDLSGAQGIKGDKGAAAGFGTPIVETETLDAGQDADVEIEASGDNNAKIFSFKFKIPRGEKGEKGDADETSAAQCNYLYDGKDLTTAFADEIAEHSDVWAWIKARIDAQNWDGLAIGDYIPFEMNGETVEAQIAGIDTYYNCGDTPIGHHIDFISRDCFSETVLWNTTVTNNGTEEQPLPWLASNIYSVLNDTWLGYLPQALQNVIVTKRMVLESRYSSSGLLEASNAWAWGDMGKLWLPLCVEVVGSSSWGTQGYSVGMGIQYPIFIGSKQAWIKGAGHNGSRCFWWTATPSGISEKRAIGIYESGYILTNNVAVASINEYAPVCFRIA